MAETKKAKQIRLHKATLLDQIADLNAKLLASTKIVPQQVRSGSHNVAVAWKELAEKVSSGIPSGTQKWTTKQLESLIKRHETMLKKLTFQ